MNKIIQQVNEMMLPQKEHPAFRPGDTITVNYKIKEGNKERVQAYKGIVIKISGHNVARTITVRKISSGVGVERIIPINSPFIDSIELNKRGKVRRSRIYYLRDLKGKKAKIKEDKSYLRTEE